MADQVASNASPSLLAHAKASWASLLDVWGRTSAKPQAKLQCAACPPGCYPREKMGSAVKNERRRLLFASLPDDPCVCPEASKP